MTWQNAQRKCEEQGLNGNLASLMSEEKLKSKFYFLSLLATLQLCVEVLYGLLSNIL